MNNTPNDPAFPADETHGDGIQHIRHHLGLTIRQEFAKAAMSGLLSAPDMAHLTFDDISDRAIRQADSLLEKLAAQS